MKLITEKIKKDLLKHPLYSQDGKGIDAKVIVKFFGGCGFTWLVTEAEQKGDDWLMYGYVTSGDDWEWRYFLFSQIKNLKFPPFGLPLERDLYTKDMSVRQLSF